MRNADVGTSRKSDQCLPPHRAAGSNLQGGTIMGRGILLWLLGVPIPVIILLALIWH
jgi:hypothetical protein